MSLKLAAYSHSAADSPKNVKSKNIPKMYSPTSHVTDQFSSRFRPSGSFWYRLHFRWFFSPISRIWTSFNNFSPQKLEAESNFCWGCFWTLTFLANLLLNVDMLLTSPTSKHICTVDLGLWNTVSRWWSKYNTDIQTLCWPSYLCYLKILRI